MLIQFEEYLTFDNIYIFSSFGVLPFWILLILLPNSKITQIFVSSVILPLFFSSAYVYIIYQIILLGYPILDFFKLYQSLDDLYTLFANESFLVVFWLHFLAINLFLGSWVSRDSVKYNVPKAILLISMLLIYFSGPLGLVFYWLFRVFYAKKIGLHD